MDKDLKLWEKAVEFHGHICGGLTIGYRGAILAMELLELDFSQDEEVVCVTENDACGVDAIQVILGCSVGKGNLLFRLRGKQAFSFFNRKTGKSIRLVLKADAMNNDCTNEERQKFLFTANSNEIFHVKEVQFVLPERARIFNSIECDSCGEKTADHLIKLQGDKKLCLDCFVPYERFM